MSIPVSSLIVIYLVLRTQKTQVNHEFLWIDKTAKKIPSARDGETMTIQETLHVYQKHSKLGSKFGVFFCCFFVVPIKFERYIWVFPKMMVPPKSSILISFSRFFHYFHHPFWWFSPYFWVDIHMTHNPMISLASFVFESSVSGFET